ncbi:2-hydroxyacid dehydrogenase [Fusobacterium watanabei]|uniref:2-hydroxyacid dehydrogenase n=1 Tax=Fusobacterium TaxID=848 RepID=UPI00123825AF|nr:2-hydroxyacid dehydrogenase [Fusobacterium nucleatum]WDA45295.1 2-hydroxyacid dehydrogenase [Fusobacterium nucleatum]
MQKTKIIFFDIKDYDKEFFKKYEKNYNFEMTFLKVRLTEETANLTKGYDVVCGFANDNINKETIDIMVENGIKLLAMRCAGFNNVSLKDIHNRFKVVRVPAYSPHAIAEYTVGLILAVNRKIHKAYVRTREGNFSINGLMGFDLDGKTAGIIGTGKIGQILIKILKGFEMKVIAYDLYPNQKAADELGFEYVSLDELYAKSDIISLNCPLTKDTQYMINRRSMLKMKDGVILVNTGRGQLIDSADLVEALKDKKIGAVALDVYEEEENYFFEDKSNQVIEDDILGRLLSFYNVLITSHQAYFTKEAVDAITVTTLNNIRDFVEGKPLVNEVLQN